MAKGADIILPVAIIGGGIAAYFLFPNEINGFIGDLFGPGGDTGTGDGEVPTDTGEGDGAVPADGGDIGGGGSGDVSTPTTGGTPSTKTPKPSTSKPPKTVIPPNQVPTTPKPKPKVKVPAKKRRVIPSKPKTQTPRACTPSHFRATTGKCLTIPHCSGSQFTGSYNKTTGVCILKTGGGSSSSSSGCPSGTYLRSGRCLAIPRCPGGYSFSTSSGRCVRASSSSYTSQLFNTTNDMLDRIFVA